MIISDRGLGSVFGLGDLVPLPSYEDPGYPPDAAIVARNNAKNAQYGLDVEKAQADNNYKVCLANAQNAATPQQYNDTLARCQGQWTDQTPDIHNAALPPAPNFNSQTLMRFTTSRAGGVLYPGDTWQIFIWGGVPGSLVSTNGALNGVPYYPGSQGSLDNNGTWIKAGTVSAGDVGVWQENWTVNGLKVGEANFTVALPQGNQTNPAVGAKVVIDPTTNPTASAGSSGGTQPTSTANSGGGVTTSLFDLGLSNTEMIGIGATVLVVGFMMLKK